MKRKIGFFGLMKSFESAQTSFEKMSGGGIKATIHHDVMKNVKVKHLRWWFENIDGTTTFNGQDFNGLEVAVYLLWHPHDHIKVFWKKKLLSPQGRVLPGSVISIKETFGGYLIEEDALISRFDNEEYNFDFKKLEDRFRELAFLNSGIEIEILDEKIIKRKIPNQKENIASWNIVARKK